MWYKTKYKIADLFVYSTMLQPDCIKHKHFLGAGHISTAVNVSEVVFFGQRKTVFMILFDKYIH